MNIFQGSLTRQWTKLVKSFGHQNGFDLKPKYPWKQNNSSRRAFWLDIPPFCIWAILMPQPWN